MARGRQVCAAGVAVLRPYEDRGGAELRAMQCDWAEYEDTRKIFTPGLAFAQVVVGVKKNRPRCVWTFRGLEATRPGPKSLTP